MNEVQKFKWALDLYRMDRAVDSAEVLKRVVDAKPAPRVVAEMREQLDPAVRTAMLVDAKTTEIMQQWLKLYEASVEKLRVDDAYVAEWVEKLASANGADADAAIRRLEQVQEFAAAKVCRMMADSQDAAHRTRGRGMLLRLGSCTTLPVIECLSSSDDSLRMVMLNVLGNLQDVRAQAAIVKVVKDPRTSDEVRKGGNEALGMILHQPRPALALSNQAAVNYWWLADAYLHEKPCCLPRMEGDELPLWKWSDEKKTVAYRMVPRKLYNEKLAEDACFDGLEVDKNDTSLKAMVIAAYYSEKLDMLGTASDELNHALDMALLVGGKQALQQCMDKAVLDGDTGIAILSADSLGAVGAGKGFTALENIKATNPLLAALAVENRALRFAAAKAVVNCQPRAAMPAGAEGPAQFDNYREVLPALSWGLMYEMPSKTVLILAPEDGTVNYYRGELKKLGHDVASATDMAGGMTLAGSLPRPDVVFVSSDFLGSVEGLKGILGSNRIPFVLLVSADGKDAAEKVAGASISGTLLDQATGDSIKQVLARVLEVPEKKTVSDLVPKISEQAAVALSEVVPSASALPMVTVVPALKRVLASRNDAVRIPALKALGNIAAPDSALAVLAVGADQASDRAVRVAALDALAKILGAQEKAEPDVFKVLVPVASDADAQVSLAAAKAITMAKFDPAQFTDLLVLKRLQEIKSGAHAE
jgi:hypothetical protein